MCLNLSQTCVVLLQSDDEVQETRKRRRSGITDPNSWKSECRQLIETMRYLWKSRQTLSPASQESDRMCCDTEITSVETFRTDIIVFIGYAMCFKHLQYHGQSIWYWKHSSIRSKEEFINTDKGSWNQCSFLQERVPD
jgi:hypothetical protein